MRALVLCSVLLVACGEAPADEAPNIPSDGGVEASYAVAPRIQSHYSWSQGCGCSSAGDPLGVVVLGLVLLFKARRRAFPLLLCASFWRPAVQNRPQRRSRR